MEKALRLVDHPEELSMEETEELLADPEVRELYEILCMTKSSVIADADSPDVDAEWQKFERRYKSRPRILGWTFSRAAAIIICVLTSLAAIAIGITVSNSIADRRAETEPQQTAEPNSQSDAPATYEGITTATTDTVTTSGETVVFENEQLETIMSAIAGRYGVQLNYADPSAAQLRLFFRWKPSMPIDEVVERLNSFEQINITLKDNILTID